MAKKRDLSRIKARRNPNQVEDEDFGNMSPEEYEALKKAGETAERDLGDLAPPEVVEPDTIDIDGILKNKPENPPVKEPEQEKLSRKIDGDMLKTEGVFKDNDKIDSVPRFNKVLDLIDSGDFEGAEKYLDIQDRLFAKSLLPEALALDSARAISEQARGKPSSDKFFQSPMFQGEKRSPFDIAIGGDEIQRRGALSEADVLFKQLAGESGKAGIAIAKQRLANETRRLNDSIRRADLQFKMAKNKDQREIAMRAAMRTLQAGEKSVNLLLNAAESGLLKNTPDSKNMVVKALKGYQERLEKYSKISKGVATDEAIDSFNGQ